jgi:hypothetical protein
VAADRQKIRSFHKRQAGRHIARLATASAKPQPRRASRNVRHRTAGIPARSKSSLPIATSLDKAVQKVA